MVHHVHLTNPEVRELQRRVEIVEYVWASDLAADFCSVEIAVAAEAASFLWKWSGESSWGKDVAYSKLTRGGNGIWRILQEPFEVILDLTLETGYLSVPYIRGPREFSRASPVSLVKTHILHVFSPSIFCLYRSPFEKDGRSAPSISNISLHAGLRAWCNCQSWWHKSVLLRRWQG